MTKRNQANEIRDQLLRKASVALFEDRLHRGRKLKRLKQARIVRDQETIARKEVEHQAHLCRLKELELEKKENIKQIKESIAKAKKLNEDKAYRKEKAELAKEAKKLKEELLAKAQLKAEEALEMLKYKVYSLISRVKDRFETTEEAHYSEEILTTFEEYRDQAVEELVEIEQFEIRSLDPALTPNTKEGRLARREISNFIYGNIQYLLKLDIFRAQRDFVRKAESRNFTAEQRRKIYLRDGGVCQLCFSEVPLNKYDCDHVIPYSLGGPTSVENGQCTCQSCNRSKGNRA